MRYLGEETNETTVPRELLAGTTTFLTMAYIIFVQPAVLSGSMFGFETGMDFGAVTTATCLSAALATCIMGLYARYPIALAPGMGQNFFFALTAIPIAATTGAAEPWRVALGAVFIAGLLFLSLSILGIRERIVDAVSQNMKFAIAVGIGLFIAFIGFRNAQLVIADPGTIIKMNPQLASPDVLVFLAGLLAATGLHARRVRGSLLWGIATASLTAVILRVSISALGLSDAPIVANSGLFTTFQIAQSVVALPPSISPTLFRMDMVAALSATMLPVVVMFLFMDVFDTMGTLIGVTEQAGLTRDGKLPRMERAMMADAVGTVAGAAMGTSTVTSYIESAAGVEQGGKTGLTALTVAGLFVVALFFSPVIAMIASYPPITAPALVLVGAMMTRNVVKIDWMDYTESVPAFLTVITIPLFNSIADGISIGLVTYPIVKLLSGRGKEVSFVMWLLMIVLVAYFAFVRTKM